jgi:hypothetical protein
MRVAVREQIPRSDSMSMQPDSGFTSSHDSLIQDQFSRQAELFARSPELHGDAQVMLLLCSSSMA